LTEIVGEIAALAKLAVGLHIAPPKSRNIRHNVHLRYYILRQRMKDNKEMSTTSRRWSVALHSFNWARLDAK
jgi:hypothetical protein